VREFSHAIERGKIKTVVVLIDDSELASHEKPEFADEVAWCRRNGVRIERIPIPLGGWPTSEDVKKFLAIVADKQNQPVLVHCAQGVRRTGMMVAAYQRSTMQWDAGRCKAAMLAFGHSQRSMGDVEKFIDVYDPATAKVPEGMPVGKE
jgi:protein tyrosine/serine phosphatase